MQKIIFKMNGCEFRTPALNGRQKLAVALFRLTGIRTDEYNHIERVNENLWRLHSEWIQRKLDEIHEQGWGFSHLTGKRVDF